MKTSEDEDPEKEKQEKEKSEKETNTEGSVGVLSGKEHIKQIGDLNLILGNKDQGQA